MRNRFSSALCISALTSLGAAGILSAPALAQSRPDIVWMAGGHSSWVYSVAFSPDGQTLASGGATTYPYFPGEIKLWRVSDGALLENYDQETGTGVLSVQFSPDGELFAYGRNDGTVVVARSPDYVPPCESCDANCDGSVDELDIEPFLELIFQGAKPCDSCAGDSNGDGIIDAFDIETFIACVLGP